MADDPALEDVFEDLEQQAAGLHLSERDAELADRVHGEYAQVTFESRVHASVGRQVRWAVAGALVVEGVLEEAGAGWVRVADGAGRPWLLRLSAVEWSAGLSSRSVPEPARPATAGLTFRSALRRLSEDGDPVTLHRVDGTQEGLVVVRVGADFVEGLPPGRDAGVPVGPVVCTFAGVAAVRGG